MTAMIECVDVLVVEDHPIFRDGLAAMFNAAPAMALVGSVGTVAEALDAMALAPDVVLLDLSLPDGTGLDVLAAAQQATPRPAVLVLSMSDDPQAVLEAVRAGACGYLVKGAGRPEVLEAVRRAAAGGAVFDAATAETVMAAARASAADPVAALGLTAREGDVLRLVAQGLDNQTIAARLGVASKTVRNQVSAILMKLGVADRAAAAARARSAGL
jgi:DNA-binding NarL/FixJ family response regulator